MTRASKGIEQIPKVISTSHTPLDCVDTLQGTDSDHNFSTGNTLPLTTLPHGMVGWSPQTDPGRWIFDRRSPKLQGFRATRQASPWLGDYGNFLITVTSGPNPPVDRNLVDSSYDRKRTVASPHRFETHLLRHDIDVEISPTLHGGYLRFRFNRPGDAWIAFIPEEGGITQIDKSAGRISGYSTSNQGGTPKGFRAHFVSVIDAKILECQRFVPKIESGAKPSVQEAVWLKVKAPRSRLVSIKIGTSFISESQAGLNLQRELEQFSFETILERARSEWDARLNTIEISGATIEQRKTFYGSLYRCFCFPRRWDETDSVGRQIHYSPFDGMVHSGPLYTDHCFWDGYRALLPLLSIIAPDTLGEMISGWLNAYKEGGWLPNCASPGYRACMVGAHSTAVIADAWLKGVRNFDPELALSSLIKDATIDSGSKHFGRAGLNTYSKFGYVPSDSIEHSVARTLDYAHADFAVHQLATALGKGNTTVGIRKRATNYRNVFDRKTGHFRAKKSDSSWKTPFSPWNWSADYIEGSAWQYRFSVPHDPKGLINLHGGDRTFVTRLDEMLEQAPRFETDFYPFEIHEMTEMAAVPFGQYAHSNEPVHHVLWLYTCAGRPDRTQYWVRRVIDELYSPDKFPGDEDTGAMGAWYVFAALGIFPLTCGHPGYVLGTPRFEQAVIRPPGRPEFKISIKGSAPRGPSLYTESVKLNGEEFRHLELPHERIAAGGELRIFTTSDAHIAATRGRLPRPFSLSK